MYTYLSTSLSLYIYIYIYIYTFIYVRESVLAVFSRAMMGEDTRNYELKHRLI